MILELIPTSKLCNFDSFHHDYPAPSEKLSSPRISLVSTGSTIILLFRRSHRHIFHFGALIQSICDGTGASLDIFARRFMSAFEFFGAREPFAHVWEIGESRSENCLLAIEHKIARRNRTHVLCYFATADIDVKNELRLFVKPESNMSRRTREKPTPRDLMDENVAVHSFLRPDAKEQPFYQEGCLSFLKGDFHFGYSVLYQDLLPDPSIRSTRLIINL